MVRLYRVGKINCGDEKAQGGIGGYKGVQGGMGGDEKVQGGVGGDEKVQGGMGTRVVVSGVRWDKRSFNIRGSYRVCT